MVTVNEPINSITTAEVFKTDAQAQSAMAGIYSQMSNGGGTMLFSNGYATILGAMSADEILNAFANVPALSDLAAFNRNKLLYNNTNSPVIWKNTYKTIYYANSVIEGIAASTSVTLTDSVRRELTAESKFVRAFCYFYLVNFFGDVPLALTVDFNKTRYMARTSAQDVYAQIIRDLKAAQAALYPDYSAVGQGTGQERILPNQAAATALLARTYLYTGDYVNAEIQATSIIDNTALYTLENDLNNVFLTSSKEAIWQLKLSPTDATFQNAIPEAFSLLPSPLANGKTNYILSDLLLNAFEPGDLRRSAWIGSTDNTIGIGTTQGITYYPYKYKIGSANAQSGVPSPENYTMLRLAEVYLIRAEARGHGVGGGADAAIEDLNKIRARAGLGDLSVGMNQTQVLAAVELERRIELFAEWGHRWLDLKRTNRAHDVLSAIPVKQPWAGDYQLLYPIPLNEIQADHFLTQTPGY